MLMQILLPGSQSSPDMPFRFVHVQYYTGTGGQGGIDLKETLGNIWWCQGRNKKNSYHYIYKTINLLK